MKKLLIGITLLIAGIIDIIGILSCATMYLPNASAWSTSYPSKLWFLIFAGHSKYDDGADGLGLGMLFGFGVILVILGLIILGIEYRKDNN